MPLPRIDVSVVDTALSQGSVVYGMGRRPIGVTTGRDWPSITEVVTRMFTGRPWSPDALTQTCRALGDLFNTSCSWALVQGLHVVTLDVATTDWMQEIQGALQAVAPSDVTVRVQTRDGRTADREEWHDEYARRAYGVERREPAPRSYTLGDGLSLNLAEGTPLDQQWMTREEILRQRLRSEVDGRRFTIDLLTRTVLMLRTVLGVDIEWDYSTGDGLGAEGPDLRVQVRRGTQEDVDIIARVLREIAPLGLQVRVQGEGRIEKIETTLSIKPEVGTCAAPVRDRFERILADEEAA